MLRYIVGRLIAMIPALLLLVFAVVVMVRLLPGSAVDVLTAQAASRGTSGGFSKTDRAQIERDLGLSDSLPMQFGKYTLNALHGDLGKSIWTKERVTTVIQRALPVTLTLSALALVWSTIIGVAIGIISAARRGRSSDYLLRTVAIVGLSIPNFALGTTLVVLPTIWWHWSPPVFYTSFDGSNFWPYISQYFTPAFVLGLALAATLMRLSRTQLLEVLRQDYMRTAHSKGLAERVSLFRHALPNVLIPVVSLLGIQVATLISGTVVIEAIFGLPGIGRLLLSAINERNYPIIQGVTLVSGILVMLVNLLVDVSYGFLNPRVRLGA
jgi:peptide/nickel transport system permease protein